MSALVTTVLHRRPLPIMTPTSGLLSAFIRIDRAASLVGIVVVVAAGLLVSPWLFLLAGCLAATVVALRFAAGRAGDRCYAVAVLVVVVALWVDALVATAFVPLALYATPLLVVLTVQLGLAYLPGRQLRAVIGASVGVSVALVVVGWMQPGLGLEIVTTELLQDVLVCVLVPSAVALNAVLVWQNHLRLAGETEALSRSRGRLVAAQDDARRRLEGELQQGVQGHIAAAVEHLGAATAIGSTAAALGRARAEVESAVDELRDLARGIYPPQLVEAGLVEALRARTVRSAVPARVEADGVGRWPTAVEAGVYFSCVEALQNASSHGGPDVEVVIRLDGRDGLVFEVVDDGVGFDPATVMDGGGRGLANLADRMGALGGRLEVASSLGAGTLVRGVVPPAAAVGSGPAGAGDRVGSLVELPGAVRLGGGAPRDAAQEHLRSVQRVIVIVNLFFWALGFIAALVLRHPLPAIVAGLTMARVVAFAVARVRWGATRPTAVMWFTAVSSWSFQLAITGLFPIFLYVAALCVIGQTFYAASFSKRRSMVAMIIGTTVAAFGLSVLARFQPGHPLAEAFPSWLETAGVVVLIPVAVAAISALAWQSYVRLRREVEALARSRERLVAARDEARRRLERDLHDGAQQRLVCAAVQLQVASRLVERRRDGLERTIGVVLDELNGATEELRRLARGIYPPQLAEGGLAAALRARAERSPVPVRVEAAGLDRWPADVEAGVYFCCVEALQNALKHAGPDAEVVICLDGRRDLRFEVSDNGVGFDPAAVEPGRGFANLADRLAALGGLLEVCAVPGKGATIRGQLVATPN